jgi:2-C-methyl-D-erythritol 4-phosphate cytidylyltransferase
MSPSAVGLVVVAAGSGSRFGGLKQLAILGDQPLLAHAMKGLGPVASQGHRVLVVPDALEAEAGWGNLRDGMGQGWTIIEGGKTRAESVRNGVSALPDSLEVVVVHDGARPFPPLRETELALGRLRDAPDLSGVIISSPVVDTIKKLLADGRSIEATLDRNQLARAETPQVCRRTHLLAALTGDTSSTDEGSALEKAGYKVEIMFHNSWNPKITVPADLELARAWLACRENKA